MSNPCGWCARAGFDKCYCGPMQPGDADRMERAAEAVEKLLRENGEMTALILELVPPEVEQHCDECGGLVIQLCPNTCPIRRARALIGRPMPDHVPHIP